MAQTFTIERVDPAHARVGGRLGFAEAAVALACGGELLDGAQSGIDVDVSGLHAVDSATLAVLLAWAARAAVAGTTLQVRGATPGLDALAHLCDAGSLLGMT